MAVCPHVLPGHAPFHVHFQRTILMSNLHEDLLAFLHINIHIAVLHTGTCVCVHKLGKLKSRHFVILKSGAPDVRVFHISKKEHHNQA